MIPNDGLPETRHAAPGTRSIQRPVSGARGPALRARRPARGILFACALVIALLAACGGKKEGEATPTPAVPPVAITPAASPTAPVDALLATPAAAATILPAAVADVGPYEYVVEVGEDGQEMNLTVISGRAVVADAAGVETAVEAGRQAQFTGASAAGVIHESPPGDDGSATGGIPLAELLVNNDAPVDYDLYVPIFLDGEIPADWVLEDPDQDTLVTAPDPFSLELTVPDENDLWGDRSGAPLLMHRITGDFDLQAELRLQTQATDLVYAQFALKAPGTLIGVRKDQMAAGMDTADYMLLPSSWYVAGGKNRIGCLTWEDRECPAGPDDFLHVRMTRRGDLFTTYISLDGERWNLHSQQTLLLPDTLWAGWLVKRVAVDGLTDEPAVATFRNIRLHTAPSFSLPTPDWDFEQLDGAVDVQGNRVTLTLDGTRLSQVYATQGAAIAGDEASGDFDIIVAYETDAWKGEAGKRPGFGVLLADLDRSDGAMKYAQGIYINAFQAEEAGALPVYATDLKIGDRWQQFRKSPDTPGSTGKFRLIRQNGAITTYYLYEGAWQRLDNFDGWEITSPVTLWLYAWNNEVAEPAALRVTFTLEQFALGERVQQTVQTLTEIAVVTEAEKSAPTAVQPVPTAPASEGPGSGGFSPFTFAAGSTADYTPIDPMTTFPEGVTSVFAVYTYQGMQVGTPNVWDWYRNGEIYLKGEDATWTSDESGGGWHRLYHPDGLPAGDYALRVYVWDQLRQEGAFTVVARAADQPAFGRILFAEGVENDLPVRPHQPYENFASGTTIVYAFFDARNMTGNGLYGREWHRDGVLLVSKSEAWLGGANEKDWWASYSNEEGLAAGVYELKLYLDNELVQLGTFVIEP